MRKVKIVLSTGFARANYEEILEIEDDITEEEMEEICEDFVWNRISVDWEYLNED